MWSFFKINESLSCFTSCGCETLSEISWLIHSFETLSCHMQTRICTIRKSSRSLVLIVVPSFRDLAPEDMCVCVCMCMCMFVCVCV